MFNCCELLPAWSAEAAIRAVRVTIVVPGLFAFTYVVIGDVQMATFTAFGGFSTLVLAGFAGTRWHLARAHLGLAVAGSVLLAVGTVVSSSTVVAVIVTAVVSFAVLFGGMTGPNAALVRPAGAGTAGGWPDGGSARRPQPGHAARQPALGVVAQQHARRPGAGGRSGHRGSDPRAARVLGGPRDVVEDVAIGCVVSLLVGVLVWPREAAGVVGDDLAEAYRHGGAYLAQATGWALGLRPQVPDADSLVVNAGLRLDEALRGFLAERGAKRLAKEDLWRLVGGAIRLRLIAHSLAGLPHPVEDPDPARTALGAQARQLAGWYDRLAAEVGPPSHSDGTQLGTLALPSPVDAGAGDETALHLSCTLWVDEHLQSLGGHLSELIAPAAKVTELRREPWWR